MKIKWDSARSDAYMICCWGQAPSEKEFRNILTLYVLQDHMAM